MALVEARGVSKQFGQVRAVDGVDLAIKEGEFLVLLGPSGCGKTTLLRIIAGLERPTAGEIVIGGQVVNDLPPRARKIAMVFQSYALYAHMSVFKNIAFPLKAAGAPRAEIPKKVEWAAGLFGIGHLLERKPRQLSGGERQRVALARAVVREPAVFLLDEPLSNLDAKLRASARDELQQFQRRIATTTLYVTHDQIEAMGLGDRIAVMQGGRVRQIGTPMEVYDEPADTFVAAFLGSPAMNLVETAEGLVGFRPEHFLPRETHTDGARLTTLPFRVARIEYLGADRLLYGILEGRFDGARVIALLATTVEAKVQAGRTEEFAVRARPQVLRPDDGPPDPGPAPVSAPRRLAFLVDRNEWLGALMIGPAVLYIVAVVGVPFLLALFYSVSDVSMGSRQLNFVGLGNFASVIQTTKFQTSLKNTFIFAIVSQVLVMVLATVLALALSGDFRGKWFVRLLILLPWVAPISLGTIGWLWILDSTYSVINWTLQAVGLLGPGDRYLWLGVPSLAMGSVIVIHVWRILPLATVILLAGLTSIPHDIHDAAQVDGASFARHLLQITVPLVRPIMLVAGLFGLVFAFTDMIVIFVLTRGGPYDTTQVLASLAFFTGIQGGDLAEGAAIAVFLFPLLVAVAIAFLRIARRSEVI